MAAGREQGQPEGQREGMSLGFAKGLELASELGYYRGVTHALLQLASLRLDERVARALSGLDEALAGLSVDDPLNQDLFDAIELVRGRYRRLVSLIGDTRLAHVPPGQPRAEPSSGASSLSW